VDHCINIHNDFVGAAEDFLLGLEAEKAPAIRLTHTRETDMLHADIYKFEAVTREFALQSLRYGEGSRFSYDFYGLQRWIFENVLDNKPKIQALYPLFPFAGESFQMKSTIGGLEQVDLGEELKDMVENQDLSTLQQQRKALSRLQECMDFLDILGSNDGQRLFGEYCVSDLQLRAHEMDDFGGPSSMIRTAVRLCHLRSLSQFLDDLLIDPIAMVSANYREPLTEGQKRSLRDAAETIDSANPPEPRCIQDPPKWDGRIGNLKFLINTVKKCIKEQFQDFGEPVPPAFLLNMFNPDDPEEFRYGTLDGAALPGRPADALSDFAWYNECFPRDLQTSQIVETFLCLQELSNEKSIGGH